MPVVCCDSQFRLRRVVFSLAAVSAYVLAFFPLYRLNGPGAAALATIPVVALAWLWGLRGGLIVGILTFPLNTLLFNLVGLEGWDAVFRQGGGPGQVMAVLIGGGIGHLRDLGERLKVEITERERAVQFLEESEKRYRRLVESSLGLICTHDLEGTLLSVNPAAAHALGYESAELVGGNQIRLLAPSVRHLFPSYLKRIREQKRDHGLLRIVTKDGDERIWAYRNVLLEEAEGNPYVLGHAQDITELKRVEEALRESEERHRNLVQGVDAIVWEADAATWQFTFVSQRGEAVLGYPVEQWLKEPDFLVNHLHPDDREQAATSCLAAIAEGGENDFEYRAVAADGRVVWLRDIVHLVRDAKGQVRELRGLMVDITEQKKAEEQLVQNAFSDALTGIANRALFLDLLGRALKRRFRHPDYLFAVLFLDLDRFKLVNDSLGHNIGDELLRAVARRLEKCLRSQDTVARLGGDEFTMFLEDIKDETDATRVAERVHKELRTSFQVDGHEIFTTSSIGIALSSTGYNQAEDVLRDADTAMYRAKALGRACYSMFDTAMHERAVALLQLDHGLRRALERKEFRLHYQPIVLLETAKVIGLEALLRWEHPERGLVSPAEFIPLAEETRLIIPIGRWGLEEACRQARAWQTQFGADLSVSVNLSAKQLLQPDLVDQIIQMLQKFSAGPRSLKLEITESMIMENIELVISMLQQLKALGIQLYMDDFGTGYSSLSYLHRLPVDVLKIDRSFVSGTALGVEKPEVVRTIMTLARDLGIDAIAEGVETAEQLAQLRGLGCKYGQGYLFSKPLDSEAAGKFIAGRLQRATGI